MANQGTSAVTVGTELLHRIIAPYHPARSRLSLKLPAAWHQAVLITAIIVMTAGLARFGPGIVARLFFVGSALTAAAFAIRRSPWRYVTLTFWFWTVTPLARRLIDYNAVFDPVNFVLGTPNLLTLFMLKDLLASRELLRQRESVIGLFIFLPLFYGLVVSLVKGDVVPSVAAIADSIAPVFYYFYFIANWRRIDEAEAEFKHFVTFNALLITVYGVYQFVSPFPWDVAWVLNSGLTAQGNPVAFEIRVFSTLNDTGVYAVWVGTCLLLFLHFRTNASMFVAPAAGFLLLTTGVRSAIGTVLLGLIVAGFMGRTSAFRFVGVVLFAVSLLGAGMSILLPSVTESITERLATVEDLGSDNSAQTRAEIYRATPDIINANPLGMGIGALGRGAVATGRLVVVDSGPLAIYLSMGWVAGSIYLFGFLLIVAQALLAARFVRSPQALALSVAALGLTAILPFVNVVGFLAATLWTCAAYSATLGIAARRKSGLSRN